MMKLPCLPMALFVCVGASDACSDAPHTDADSMIQVARKDKFCLDFFGAEDQDFVTQGLQQAEIMFVRYCMSADFTSADCKGIATNIFENATDLDEELCDKLMAEQEAHHAPADPEVLMGVSQGPVLDLSHRPQGEGDEPGDRHNMGSPHYIDDNDYARIVAVSFHHREENFYGGEWFAMCAEVGSTTPAEHDVRQDLREFLESGELGGYVTNLEDITFPNVCGPRYDRFWKSKSYPVTWACGNVFCGYEINIYYRTAMDFARISPADWVRTRTNDYFNRRTRDQPRTDAETRIVLAKFSYLNQERCVEIASAPNEASINDNSAWLQQHLPTRVRHPTLRVEMINERYKYNGYACGSKWNDFLAEYAADDRVVRVWTNTRRRLR